MGGAGFSLRGKKALGKPSCMIFAASSAAVFGKLIKPRRGEGEIFVVLCEIFWHGKMVQCSRQCFWVNYFPVDFWEKKSCGDSKQFFHYLIFFIFSWTWFVLYHLNKEFLKKYFVQIQQFMKSILVPHKAFFIIALKFKTIQLLQYCKLVEECNACYSE